MRFGVEILEKRRSVPGLPRRVQFGRKKTRLGRKKMLFGRLWTQKNAFQRVLLDRFDGPSQKRCRCSKGTGKRVLHRKPIFSEKAIKKGSFETLGMCFSFFFPKTAGKVFIPKLCVAILCGSVSAIKTLQANSGWLTELTSHCSRRASRSFRSPTPFANTMFPNCFQYFRMKTCET